MRYLLLGVACLLLIAACDNPTPTTQNAEPAASPDSHGLIPVEGHVHVGTILYLQGERVGPITSLEDAPNPAFTDQRVTHSVHFERNGKPDQTPLNVLLKIYRVRPDEK